MKKVLLISFLITSLVIQGFSQSKIIMPSSQYEILKSKGQLKQGVEYVPISENHPSSVSSKVTKEHLDRMNYKSVNTTSCSCLVPIDGTFSVAEFSGYTPPDYRNDDASTPLKAIPFTFCMYGTNYTSLYINNNGNITFDAAYSQFSAVGFPSSSYVMVAPFWADVDTRNTASGLVYYKITPTYMIVQWKNVGYYSMMTDMVNTFQLIITDGTDPILPQGNNIAFCYGDMQWTTGAASSGIGGFGGIASTVGINKGDGVNYVQMGRFDQPGIAYDGGYGNNDGVSWLDNQSMYFNVCSSTNIAPIASGLNNCDTIKICGTGDTLLLNGLFLSPEIGQTTNISVNLNNTPGASIISNTSGNAADAVVMIVATNLNAGNNIITYTATDNGSPVGITVINVNVFVDTTGISNFNPQITGNPSLCFGSTTTLSVIPTNYDSYVWSNGSFSTSIQADTSGLYWVTASLNGCYKSTFMNVVEHHPTPVIAGFPFTCAGNNTTLYSDSLIYASYLWSNGSTNDTVSVPDGTYTLTVVDSFGCTATSPPVTVTGPQPPVITGQTDVCNGSLAVLWTTFQYVAYLWSDPGNPNLSTQDTIHVPASGPYTVQVTDGAGCVTTSLPFTVNPFNYALSVTGVQPYCAGQSINLTATTNNSNNTPTYVWSTSSTSPTISVNSAGTYTVTLHYSNGCTADSVITVPAPNPLPTPVIQGATFTCDTSHTILSINNSYGSYSWTPGSSTNSTISVSQGIFSVTVTDANGCVGTSQPDTVVNITPTVNIAAPNVPFCPGSNALLTANPNPSTGASYVWSTTQTTQAITVNSAGTYNVEVSYSNGCTSANSIIVTLYDAPTANFTASPGGQSGPLVPISFTDASTIPSGNITTWTWSFGDSTGITHTYLTPTIPTHSYAVNGMYTITLTVCGSNGCCDTIQYPYSIVSDIDQPNVITPNNPGANGLNQYLYFKNLEYFPGSKLLVYNRWGNKVFESNDYDNKWNGGKETDGVYYYILSGPLFKEAKCGFFHLLR